MSTPFGPNNNPPPPQGVWPPPPGGLNPYATPLQENTSGMKGPVPPEIAALKWNWGAFFLSFLWTVNHKMVWGWGLLVLGLLSRIPYVGWLFWLANLGISIFLGLKGHQLAWQNRRFEGGLTQYFEVQNAWMKWGIGVTIVLTVLGFIAGLMIGLSGALHGSSSSTFGQ